MSTLFVNTIKPQAGTVVAVSGALEVSGAIKAYELNTITVSNTEYLGSTSFGNSSGDTHQFTGSVFLSGSGLTIHGAEAGTAAINLKADQADDAADTTTLSVADGGAFTLDCASNIELNADGGTVTIKDASTTLFTFTANDIDVASGNLTFDVAGNIELNADGGSVTMKDASTTLFTFAANEIDVASGNLTLDVAGDIILDAAGGDVLPASDNATNLGSSSKRWANLYTGDLHLKNDRGDWTILEEQDYLCVVNNVTGKKYKMMLQEIDD